MNFYTSISASFRFKYNSLLFFESLHFLETYFQINRKNVKLSAIDSYDKYLYLCVRSSTDVDQPPGILRELSFMQIPVT